MTTKREARRQRAEEAKEAKARQTRRQVIRGRLIMVAVVVALGVIGYLMASDRRSAPPGKVWSPEHGHWHDR